MSKTKQQKVISEMLENGGVVSTAMEKAEYSAAYSKNPQKLTATQSFQELLNKVIPDEILTDKHRELLNAQKVISANVYASGKDGKPVNDFIEVPDNQTQIKAVELGYKIKNKITDKADITSGGQRIPLLGGISVRDNDSDQEDTGTQEEN